MNIQSFLYLTVVSLVIAGPLFFQVFPKFRITRLGPFVKAILVSLSILIPFDMLFTHLNIWGFSQEYITGVYLVGLPIEEWLFFISVPFACLYIYWHLGQYSFVWLRAYMRFLIGVLMVIGLGLLFTGIDKSYTVSIAISVIIVQIISWQRRFSWLPRLWVLFAISFPLFILTNGVLTGMFNFNQQPVVWYDPTAVTGFRLGSIPIEDLFYLYLLLFILVWGFEREFFNKEKI